MRVIMVGRLRDETLEALLVWGLQDRASSVALAPVSAVIAAKLRFRAVLMTAISFILGVIPLVIATGAGSASRRSLGIIVFGGMMVAAILGTLLIPGFYFVVQSTREWLKSKISSK